MFILFFDDYGFVLEIEVSQGQKLLNITLRSTDVYKNCCWIGKIVPPEKIINNLNADYHVKPHHAAF